MNQESPASISNGKVRKRWIALGLIILAFVFWRGMHPTYQGHGMQYWFETYTREGVHEFRVKSIPPLSAAQQEALEAFRYFGTDGLIYLLDQATQGSRPSKFTVGIENILESLPWHPRGDFESNRYYRIATANELLNQLGIPFEFAQSHAIPHEGIAHSKALTKELRMYQWVTNHFKAVERKAGDHLNHVDERVRSNANRALVNITKRLGSIPKAWAEKLLKQEQPNHYLLARLAPHFTDIEEYLLTKLKSSKPWESFRASACLAFAFPDSENYRQELLKYLIPGADPTSENQYGFYIYFLT